MRDINKLYAMMLMIINKYKPKFDHLTWYDKTLIGFVSIGILVSLYVYACTCSIQNIETLKQLSIFFLVIKLLDYLAITMIVIGLIFRKERLSQLQQLLGLIIVGSVSIVTILQFIPCVVYGATVGEIKYSLFCPHYSIITWINLLWFSVIGAANIVLPILFRKK
jgi:hypothetical protein